MSVKIRKALPSDAAELVEIYAYYILNTAVTFEYEVPSAEEFAERIRHTLERYPYLVAEEEGKILGYAYIGAFVGRKACERSAETSIYLREGCTGKGIGKRLYRAIEEVSKKQNIINLNACIAVTDDKNDPYLSPNSPKFHEHLGYQFVGRFHKCGYKFGRWYDLIWMEKMLSQHAEKPEELILFPEIGWKPS